MPDKIISRYSDAEAVADGDLVVVSKRGDRITNGLFAFLSSAAPEGHHPPPSRWQVPLFQWVAAKTADLKAVALGNGFIEGHRDEVVRSEEAGRTLVAHLITNDHGRLAGFSMYQGEEPEDLLPHLVSRKVWLLPNECDGITMMFPEEY